MDAAVAAALCQGVLNPFASGPGGGAFIVVRLARVYLRMPCWLWSRCGAGCLATHWFGGRVALVPAIVVHTLLFQAARQAVYVVEKGRGGGGV